MKKKGLFFPSNDRKRISESIFRSKKSPHIFLTIFFLFFLSPPSLFFISLSSLLLVFCPTLLSLSIPPFFFSTSNQMATPHTPVHKSIELTEEFFNAYQRLDIGDMEAEDAAATTHPRISKTRRDGFVPFYPSATLVRGGVVLPYDSLGMVSWAGFFIPKEDALKIAITALSDFNESFRRVISAVQDVVSREAECSVSSIAPEHAGEMVGFSLTSSTNEDGELYFHKEVDGVRDEHEWCIPKSIATELWCASRALWIPSRYPGSGERFEQCRDHYTKVLRAAFAARVRTRQV